MKNAWHDLDGIIHLENEQMAATFDQRTGSLVAFENKKTGWKIQEDPSSSQSFRLVVPLPERLLNLVDGKKQKAPAIELEEDELRLTLTWEGVESEHGGWLDIDLKASVSLDSQGLTCLMEIENRSPYRVESCAYPVIGKLQKPETSKQLTRASCVYDGMVLRSLYPEFPNERGYWGTEFPIQMVSTPETLFLLVLGQGEGLYIGCHDTSAQERVELTFQLIPGYGKPGFFPLEDEVAGQVVRLEFCAQHFPFVQPGEIRRLSPITLLPFSGDWHAGVNIYKSWRETWMHRPFTPGWLDEVHAWRMLQMSSWGDTLNICYQDLPSYIEECARHEVEAIQLIGWTLYGQDGRLPIHDIDPRLGTWQELSDAIEIARAKGVRIVLYEKYTCTDVSTEWYQKELHQYASKDIFGNTHGHEGWRYDTPSHLAGINTRPYAWMCMNSDRWQAVAIEEIRKSLVLKPDGILLDESGGHGSNAHYCFAENHGHRRPAYNYGGDASFEQKLCSLLEDTDPNLILGGEGPYDLQNRHYTVSYHRAGEGHIPVMRYIDPYLPMVSWAYGYDDRESINLCLLYRYIISYEPRHFRGRLEEFPLTLEYGKKVDALRKKFSGYLWEAEFQDTVGAEVTLDGRPHQPYSVFKQKKTGNRAIIIANQNLSQEKAIEVKLDMPHGELWLVTPEDQDPHPLNGPLVVPPRSAVVILENYKH